VPEFAAALLMIDQLRATSGVLAHLCYVVPAQLYEIGEQPINPRRRQALTAAAIALTAGLVGVGLFALSGGLDRTVSERVHGGQTRVVRVALVDAVLGFDVTPDRLLVDRGTPLVLEVVNDGEEAHDLALEAGPRTKRLGPGQSQRLDLGVISANVPQLYCTLPGHKAAGMTLDVHIQAVAGGHRPRTRLASRIYPRESATATPKPGGGAEGRRAQDY
jgi:nitrite reductase (NO-forming)